MDNIYACVFPINSCRPSLETKKITVPGKFLNIFTLSMEKLKSHRNHMVIASSMHPVLGELRTLFLEGVTRSSKIIWSSVKSNWGTNNRGKTPPAITSEINFYAGEIQGTRIMLLLSLSPDYLLEIPT